MADQAHFDRLDRDFAGLLEELAATWPSNDLEFVREEVGHGEYGEALENLIALGLRNRGRFSHQQVKHVQSLAAAMGMTDSPLLVRLREASMGPV